MIRFRNFIVLILALVLLQGLFSQQQYLDVEDIKEEWKDFTSFQRQELVSYTNFLYNEGFYERALLGYFQFLYKYPKDELEIATYFQIAKSYENMENWDLARNYYNRIIEKSELDGANSNAANIKFSLLIYQIRIMI